MKGLVANYSLSGESYSPLLLEYVKNWNNTEFVDPQDNLLEKFGPAEFSAQMNSATKAISLAGRMMEVFLYHCC